MKEEDKRSCAIRSKKKRPSATGRQFPRRTRKQAKRPTRSRRKKTHTRLGRRKKNARAMGKPIQSVVSKMHKCMYRIISLRHGRPLFISSSIGELHWLIAFSGIGGIGVKKTRNIKKNLRIKKTFSAHQK